MTQNINAPIPIPIKKARMFPLPEWYLPKGTINAADDQLERASSSCERWGMGFAGVVVISVIAELIIAWIQPPYLSFLTDSAVSDAAIAIGIVGEVLLGTMWNNHIQTELRKRSNKELSDAIDRATVLERIALPRRLSAEDKVKMTNFLRPIAASLYVYIEFQIGDAEAFIYANDIADAFRVAGAPPAKGGPNSFPLEVVLGVHCSVEPKVQISSIQDAFAALQIPLSIRSWSPLWLAPVPQTEPRPNVRIFVGPKPPPDIPFPYPGTAHQSSVASTTSKARE